MTIDFEKVEAELFATLEQAAKTAISKVALRNVRKACSTLLKIDANITTAGVASFIQNDDNYDLFENVNGKVPPKRQSIQNSEGLKSIVELYKGQQATKTSSRKVALTKPANKYPSQGLDTKTKLYIDMMEQQIKSLRAEVNNLSKLAEERSKSTPINLHLSHQETDRQGAGSLVLIEDNSAQESVGDQILRKIFESPNDSELSKFLGLKRRNGRAALCLLGQSSSPRLITPTEWEYLEEKFGDE